MRILFDHQAFSMQTYGGISRYFTELIDGIGKTTAHETTLALRYTNNVYARERFPGLTGFFPTLSFRGKTRLLSTINKRVSYQALDQQLFSVYHATYYDPYGLKLTGRKPVVMTIHDMIHERLGPAYAALGDYQRLSAQKRQMAERADRIITVSDCTKRDVVELFNISPAKIQVIHLANSLQVSAKTSQSEPAPYLLFVGNRGIYKNFWGMLDAIHPLLRQYQIKLICAGGGIFGPEERQRLQTLTLESWVEQRPITDAQLPQLYQEAVAFIFPSHYEGFGIPVLEAFACGCPCVLSNTTSLPEVAGEAGLYFGPTHPDTLYKAVEQLLTDAALRANLVWRGYRRLADFSWGRTVAQTLGVYEACLSDQAIGAFN